MNLRTMQRWKRKQHPTLSFQDQVKRFYREYGISPSFSKHILRALPREAVRNTDHQGRQDLRDWNVFTIDPDEAKDYDDALSVHQTGPSSHVIGVHISDVSTWIQEGTPLDKEARKRGNSLYLPWGFVPMLPPKLTCDVSSLLPGHNRLAISCLFQVHNHQVEGFEFTPSIVCSRKRLTYTQAQAILDGDQAPVEPWLLPALWELRQAAIPLRRAREKRGELRFDVPEYEAKLDEHNQPQTLVVRQNFESNRMVEDWMLQTNETVAWFLKQRGIPILYRNHAKLDRADMHEFHTLCRGLNITIKGKTITHQFQHALDEIRGTPYASILYRLLLRTMPKARYEHENHGHFGIGAKWYTHFTSPIRRYPDLVVHRALKQVLHHGVPIQKTKRKGKAKHSNKPSRSLKHLGQHCSNCEQRSLKMEREAYRWMACRYMQGREQQRFHGYVSGVAPVGLFVELAEIPVEGLVLRRHLYQRGIHRYEPDKLRFVGNHKDKQYAIGQPLEVEIRRVDPERRHIDLAIV